MDMLLIKSLERKVEFSKGVLNLLPKIVLNRLEREFNRYEAPVFCAKGFVGHMVCSAYDSEEFATNLINMSRKDFGKWLLVNLINRYA